MFRGLINDAKTAAGSVITKYAARASVAVPFIIALGFVTAGVTLTLVERFGHRNSYFMVAGGFLVLGLLAATIVSVTEHDDVMADEQASKADTADVASDAAAAAAVQMPLVLLGALFSSPAGPSSLPSISRVLGPTCRLCSCWLRWVCCSGQSPLKKLWLTEMPMTLPIAGFCGPMALTGQARSRRRPACLMIRPLPVEGTR